MTTVAGERRVALVTGASGALGGEVARVLDARGFSIAVHYRNNAEGAAKLRAELKNPAILVGADVASWEEVNLAAQTAAEQLGPVDVLVNCAGMRRDGLMATQGVVEWRTVMEVNLLGTFHMCRAVVPQMLLRRWGRIINVVSPAGLVGVRGQTAYSASKAGIIGLTRSLAAECGRRGVTVNALSPGFMRTAMTSDVTRESVEVISARLAIPRITDPQEVAVAVTFLLDCDYVTGQTISVDGGIAG
jgi:3-oxoacyl-[acyl-carrier protein] reductase